MPTPQELKKELANNEAQRRASLKVNTHAGRLTALAEARAAANALIEHHAQQHAREGTEAATVGTSSLAALDATVETTRRACAAALLERAFGRDGLPPLVTEWRREPSRVATVALQRAWRELDAIARAQLGEPIGEHLMTAAFIDVIVSEQPARITTLCIIDNSGNVDDATIAALGSWTKAAGDPGAAQRALEALEAALSRVGRRGECYPVEDHHRELCGLRKRCATRVDWVHAQAAFYERQAKIAQARFEASYVPPSRERPLPVPDAADGGGGGLLAMIRDRRIFW